MSFIVSTACVRIKAPGVAKNVLMQLAEIANDDGYCFPSLETLCMRTCWGRTAVIEAIAWLEQHRAIAADRSNGRKTRYWVTPDDFTGERFPGLPKLSAASNQSAKRTGVPVRQTDPTGTPGGLNQSAKRTLTTNNNQEYQYPPTPQRGGTPGFESFFAGFPRQVDEAKARGEWERLAPDEALRARITAAVNAWARSPEWQRENGRYIPKPSNWLRHKRWLDVPGVVTPPAAAPAPLPVLPVLTQEQLAENARRARELADLTRRALAARNTPAGAVA